jgi:transposase
MPPVREGYRYHGLPSTSGQVEQRWGLIYSAARRPQAQRTVAKPRLTQGDKEVPAFQKLCRTAFACAADAQQALATFQRGFQATDRHESTIRASPCYDKRGRPRQDAPPARLVYRLAGALASRLATRQARVDQPPGCILATNELADAQLPPQALWDGYKGQGQAERGFRFLKDPQFLAASLDLKKPERIMALLLVMTVWLLG